MENISQPISSKIEKAKQKMEEIEKNFFLTKKGTGKSHQKMLQSHKKVKRSRLKEKNRRQVVAAQRRVGSSTMKK